MPEDASSDGELRKRAAWLLGLLVIVAVLLIVVMTTLLHSGGGGGGNTGVGPDPITDTAPPSATGHRSTGTPSAPASTPATSTGSSTSPAPGAATCPTSAACALDGDVGNAAAAIAAYLKSQGRPAVPVTVSAAAKQCALSRGNGCSGGWAETEIPAPANGTLAVQKISQFAKFSDPAMKAVQIGWAYDPGSKTYYFSTIRTG